MRRTSPATASIASAMPGAIAASPPTTQHGPRPGDRGGGDLGQSLGLDQQDGHPQVRGQGRRRERVREARRRARPARWRRRRAPAPRRSRPRSRSGRGRRRGATVRPRSLRSCSTCGAERGATAQQHGLRRAEPRDLHGGRRRQPRRCGSAAAAPRVRTASGAPASASANASARASTTVSAVDEAGAGDQRGGLDAALAAVADDLASAPSGPNGTETGAGPSGRPPGPSA